MITCDSVARARQTEASRAKPARSPASITPAAAAGALLTTLLLVTGVSIAAPPAAVTEPPPDARACPDIVDDADRLRCFDEAARPPAPPTAREAGGDGAKETDSESPAAEAEPSFLSRVWELDADSRNRSFPIALHNLNYILPFSYNFSENAASTQAASPDKRVQSSEFKGQVSFKMKLWESILGRDVDLWIAHTQLFFWQLYNEADSAYFRDTNYAPEILLNFRTDYEVLGFRGRYVAVGVLHQSNGRSRPLSRSWNRLVANFGFERGDLAVVLNTWFRIPESEDDDDNHDISDFMGYGQLNFTYFWRDNRFDLFWRNNFDFHRNRGALQAEWSFPLARWVAGYVQVFNGYGEGLLDYDDFATRIGVGFSLRNWGEPPKSSE